MPRITMSPWLAAGAGLGQGFNEGYMAGSQLNLQRQQVQQQKNRDAVNLLMSGVKNMPDDPTEAQNYWDNFGQVFQQFTGKPLPPWKIGQVKSASDKLKAQIDSFVQAGYSEEDARAYAAQSALGGKGIPKQPEQRIPWQSPVSGKTYMLKPGEAARTEASVILGRERMGLTQQGIDLRERGQEQQESQFGRKLEQSERHFQEKPKKDEEEAIEKMALKRIEKSIDYKMGTDEERSAMLEKTKETIRKEKQQRAPTKGKSPGTSDAAYESFKKAFAKNPAAAIKRSQELGDGFAERYKRELPKPM